VWTGKTEINQERIVTKKAVSAAVLLVVMKVVLSNFSIIAKGSYLSPGARNRRATYGTSTNRCSCGCNNLYSVLFVTRRATAFCHELAYSHYNTARCLGDGTTQWYSAGLRAGWSRVRVPARAGNFFHHRTVAHPASYPMSTRGSFPGSKVAGVWNWPLTSVYCRGWECVELYLHSSIYLQGVVYNSAQDTSSGHGT
jgi:hypothetical protein